MSWASSSLDFKGSELRLLVAKYRDQHFPVIQKKAVSLAEDRAQVYSRSPRYPAHHRSHRLTMAPLMGEPNLCFLDSENGILFSIMSEDTVSWL